MMVKFINLFVGMVQLAPNLFSHPDIVATFDSIDNAQIDMICYLDEIASFGSMPVNQKDFFLSLFFRCFKTMIL